MWIVIFVINLLDQNFILICITQNIIVKKMVCFLAKLVKIDIQILIFIKGMLEIVKKSLNTRESMKILMENYYVMFVTPNFQSYNISKNIFLNVRKKKNTRIIFIACKTSPFVMLFAFKVLLVTRTNVPDQWRKSFNAGVSQKFFHREFLEQKVLEQKVPEQKVLEKKVLKQKILEHKVLEEKNHLGGIHWT